MQAGVESRSGQERERRQLRRLEMLIDVVYAIVIWRVFMLLPRPEEGNLDAASIAEFLFANKIDLLMIVVGLVIVIIYWTQNNAMFGNLARTDNRHTALTIIQIFSLLLFLYAMRVGTFFDGTVGARVLESVTAAMVGITSVWSWQYAVKDRRLLRDDFSDADARDLQNKIMAEPAAALLTIPCAFIGPWVWEIAWLSFIPTAQIIKRLRPKQPSA
jgi:uncharacterized membrane protein